MKNKKSISFLNGLLIVMLGVILTILIGVIYLKVAKGEFFHNIMGTIVGSAILMGYFITILTLKKIVESVKAKDPFVSDNVTYFRRIGIYILVIGIVEAIINYPIPNNSGIEILATSNGSIKPIFFLYLVLSIMSFVLGDVFRMAMEIKDENDLTV